MLEQLYDQFLFIMFAFVHCYYQPRYNAQVKFMDAQIRMLQSRLEQLGKDRIVPTPAERAELLNIGDALGHDVKDILRIVTFGTYKRWMREKKLGRTPKKSGRPRIEETTRALVRRLALENKLWGFRRIVGELKKLGIKLHPITVRNILREAEIFPDPKKGGKAPPTTWTQFIHAHIDSFMATDFFSKNVWTFSGRRIAFCLVFLHLGTRKVFVSPPTFEPSHDWVKQQSRNAVLWLEKIGEEPLYMIRDNDKKYPADWLDEFWKSEGVEILRTPIAAPRANAFVEAYIGKMKRECLNHFICFGLEHLDTINKIWIRY